MFRNTRFLELLKELPRGVFDRLVRERGADKHSKGFRRWNQLLAMVFAQLSGAVSLRTLETSFNQHARHHYHLGTGRLHRSTLAEANAKSDKGLYEALCQHLMAGVSRALRRQSQELLYLLDSTSFTLKGLGFDSWTLSKRTRNTQGVKLHVLYQAQAQVPLYAHLTPANVNDVSDAQRLTLERGATYVFDKGYCDYNWWQRIERAQARFVTRFKRNAALLVLEARPLPEQGDEARILKDEIVRFQNHHPGGGRRNHFTGRLRRITIARPEHPAPLVLATNDLSTPAAEIAALYKRRWEIELFFKWIKQNLRIKRFLGRSEQAVRIQLLTALIAYLLLALYRQRRCPHLSMRQCLITLAASLFQRPDIERHLLEKQRKHHTQLQALQVALPL